MRSVGEICICNCEQSQGSELNWLAKDVCVRELATYRLASQFEVVKVVQFDGA